MTNLKNFSQFILENKKDIALFEPQYFNLPYSIPEDRFEGGLIKNNLFRKSSNTREISQTSSKYGSRDEFFAKNPINIVEKKLLTEINKVVKFISNNPLTGKKANPSFSQNLSLVKYLDAVANEEDELFGTIETDLPFSKIRVDYDIYKDIPVFTFWHDGDLFYYYGVFTLESNDVTGSGELHTYITIKEVIDYLFYDYIWRAAFNELAQIGIESIELGFSESEFNDLADADINDSKQVVNNYFDKRFIKMLHNWIETGDPTPPTSKKAKFDYYTIPSFGMMSFPGNSGKLLKMSQGPTSDTYTVRLLLLDLEYTYLAVKFNYDKSGITSIESGEFSTDYGWAAVNWKPLSADEVNTLYFIDDKGRIVWVKNLIN